MDEVDLDRLARAYDFRLDRGMSVRISQMLAEAAIDATSMVVDVGGGRGAKAQAVAATGATVISVDPSGTMARSAARLGLWSVMGRGEALPFPDALADLVFFHLSIHHGGWRAMLDEAWRVVRPGGVVWVWTMADSHHRTSYLNEWFPSIAEIDRRRFPAVTALAAYLGDLGGSAETTTHVELVERQAGEFMAAVRAGYVSTLHLIPDGEVAAGLERFGEVHPDPEETIAYRLDFAGVWSRRPLSHNTHSTPAS